MAKKNIIATINNINDNELNVLKIMFGDRISINIATINTAKAADTAKAAPTRKTEAEKMAAMKQRAIEKDAEVQKDEVKKTRQDGINEWLIKKYGDLETAAEVQAMTKVIADEWREEARRTGKFVVKKSEYKTKLYETAYERVLAEREAAKAATKKTTRGRKTTKGQAKA